MCRWKLSRILHEAGFNFSPVKRDMKTRHLNKILTQQLWCRRFVWHRYVCGAVCYWIDESSHNFSRMRHRVWQKPTEPVRVKLNSPFGSSLTWIGAVCSHSPTQSFEEPNQLIYSIADTTNQETYHEFLEKKLSKHIELFDQDQMVILIVDGHKAHFGAKVD